MTSKRLIIRPEAQSEMHDATRWTSASGYLETPLNLVRARAVYAVYSLPAGATP